MIEKSCVSGVVEVSPPKRLPRWICGCKTYAGSGGIHELTVLQYVDAESSCPTVTPQNRVRSESNGVSTMNPSPRSALEELQRAAERSGREGKNPLRMTMKGSGDSLCY